MLADIGLLALVIAFPLAAYATAASAWGDRKNRSALVESARNVSLLVVPLLTISVVILVYELYTLDSSFGR